MPLDVGDTTGMRADIAAELGLDEGGIDYRISVYQHGGKGLAWLSDYTLSDDKPLLERLRDDHGGGVFEVRIYKAGKLAKRHKVVVGTVKPKTEGLGGADIMGMMREMQAQTLKQAEALISHVQPPAAPAVDPAQLEARMLARMVTYKELFAQPAAPRGPDTLAQFRDFLEVSRELGIGQQGEGDGDR